LYNLSIQKKCPPSVFPVLPFCVVRHIHLV
jgi:hypothetical protein